VLRRRLHADATSIQQLIDTARFQVARQLLRETHLSLAEIASALRQFGRDGILPGVSRMGGYDAERMAEPHQGGAGPRWRRRFRQGCPVEPLTLPPTLVLHYRRRAG